MVTGGIVILFVALLAWIGFGVQKFKAGRLSKAPFVQTNEAATGGESVAGPKGAISVQGNVNAPELLTSPVTRTECLYYDLAVIAEWKAGDSKSTQEVLREKHGAPVTLDDGSGPVRLDLSGGGDFDDIEESFSKKKGRKIISTSNSIEFGDHGFSVLAGQKVNGVRIPDDAKYKVTERVLRPQPSLYANGKLEDGVVSSPSWASLILSSKTRDQLVGDTQAFAQKLMYGASAGTAVGAILSIAGTFIAG